MNRDERQEVLTIDAKDQNVGLFVEPPNKKLEVISKQEKPAMTTLREAAQQALEALEKATRYMSDSDYQKLNEAIETLRAALVEPIETVNKTPAWWMDGLTATLMREGVNKHRAKEIAKGYWEAYCEVPIDEEQPK